MVPAIAHSATMNNYFIRYKQLIIDLIVVTNLKLKLICQAYLALKIGKKLPLDTKFFNRWLLCKDGGGVLKVQMNL